MPRSRGGSSGAGAKPAPRSGRFLDHRLDPIALEIREALRDPREQDSEPEHPGVVTQ
jgi:hypothetical protein